MHIGYIGLGKMGQNMVARLAEHNHTLIAYDPDEEARAKAEQNGIQTTDSAQALVENVDAPRIIWIMVPHKAVDSVVSELTPLLSSGDTLIDGGNSHYKESQRRAAELAARGIHFLDAGVSGGPDGAQSGACIMVGGQREVFDTCEPLFRDLAAPDGYGYISASGAGHFVKMVHNGIEYGMMQAIAEGFTLMHETQEFDVDLQEVARVYNHASVIESRLIGWTEEGLREFGEALDDVSGTVQHTGEGKWTIETAEEAGVSMPVINEAFNFRKASTDSPSYTGKILMMLRNRFGGHDIR